MNSLVHSHFVDKVLIGFILLLELCLLVFDKVTSSIQVLLDNIVKQKLLIQFSVFASNFDPVLEFVEILAWSHFDLKLFVHSLEVVDLLHRVFKAFDVAVVQSIERLSFFIEVDEVIILQQT